MWRERCMKTRLSVGHSEQLGYHLKSVNVGALFPQWKATSSPQIRVRAWLSEAIIFCHTIALLIPWETHVDTTYFGHHHPYLLPLTLLDSMPCPLQPLSTSCPLLTLVYKPLVWFCCPFVNANRAIIEHSQSTRVHTHKTTDSHRAVGSFSVQSWVGPRVPFPLHARMVRSHFVQATTSTVSSWVWQFLVLVYINDTISLQSFQTSDYYNLPGPSSLSLRGEGV